MNSPELNIVRPRDGDVLTRHDGVEAGDCLTITVQGEASANAAVAVNGIPAQRDAAAFSCDVPLTRRHSEIVVQAGGDSKTIRVWWNQGSRKRYRFSVDDNIQFMKDLGTNSEQYHSLFDHWYLGFWRDVHREYGAKFHINIYYQTDGFDLAQMPDKWKDEWQENAAWLHLSFHALQDKPDRPYRHAGYAQMAHDYDLVCGHIRRFAGNEVLSTTTTVHWAECPRDGVRALRDRGIEQLIGLFGVRNGVCMTGYYLSPADCAYIDSRPAWYDADTGVFLIPCALVVNTIEAQAIEPYLDTRAASPHAAEMVELLIHEQYFRKELSYYQPTVMDKVRTALDWVTRRGYAPVFWSDGFLGT